LGFEVWIGDAAEISRQRVFSAGRLPEAERSARQAILGNAKLSMAYLLLANIHLRQSDMRALVSDLNAYLRLDPDGADKSQARAHPRGGRAGACDTTTRKQCDESPRHPVRSTPFCPGPELTQL
jgi:hypothetical protein